MVMRDDAAGVPSHNRGAKEEIVYRDDLTFIYKSNDRIILDK